MAQKSRRSSSSSRSPRRPHGARDRVIASVVVVFGVLFIGAGLAYDHQRNDTATAAVDRVDLPDTETEVWPLTAWLGDSYTAGARAGGEPNRFTSIVCTEKRWRCTINGHGGTGFTNAGTGDHGETVFLERVPALDRNGRPSMVIVQGGTNDSGDVDEVRSAATALFDAIKAEYPEARVIAIGPTSPPAVDSARITANRDAIRDAAQAGGIQFIDPIAENWITDPAQYSDDDVHLNSDGYRVYADRLAADVA